MRSYSITVRPDSVSGKYFSFAVKGSLVLWILSATVVALMIIGAVIYYAVIVPYETVSIRSAEAVRFKENIRNLRASLNTRKAAVESFHKQIQFHLEATDKLNFLFGIEDVGGGGYRVDGHNEIDVLLDGLELVEQRYNRLENYIDTFDQLPIRFPLDCEFNFTSGFGPRRSPFSRRVEMHRGIDLATDHGEIIKAAGAGIVEVAGRWHDLGNPEYARLGRFVMIRHGNTNYKSIYGHCSVILVKKGQWVKAGQTIGKIGNTGWSTGPHLHFSIIYKERFVDPTFYLLNFDAESIVDSVFVD